MLSTARSFAGVLLLIAAAAFAHAADSSKLHIDNVWARATAPGMAMTAVYFTVTSADGWDRLIGVSTPVAARATLHRTMEHDGMTSMMPVASAKVAPEAPLRFAPGGYHVMVMGLKQPLKAGDHFPLTLHFEKSGDVSAEVTVKPLTFTGKHGGEQSDMDHGEHAHMDMGSKEQPE